MLQKKYLVFLLMIIIISVKKLLIFIFLFLKNYSEKVKDIDLIDDVVSSLENNNLLKD